MKFTSIKWRITAFFILLSTGFMGIYVLVTKQIFETDKISYVFDSKQIQNDQYSQNVALQISRVLFDSRAILSGLRADENHVSAACERLFRGQELLIALEVKEVQTGRTLISLEKDNGVIARLGDRGNSALTGDELRITRIAGTRFLAESTQVGEGVAPARFRIVFDVHSPFKVAGDGELLALVDNKKIVIQENSGILPAQALAGFIAEQSDRTVGETSIQKIDGKKFLFSSSAVKNTALSVISILDEKTALKALGVLYYRSLIFLVFAFFTTILLALIASNSITRSIFDLRRVAEKIGQGDFDAEPEFEPSDEMGTLAAAFKKMGGEIRKLLAETAQKTRMEAELQTAKIVQTNLFPSSRAHQAGRLKVAGMNASSSECSGDWWYHFDKAEDLYVLIADATGHGTPAALITAAARSLFSYIQRAELTLIEIADLWNRAIHECSGGQVCMTALILKINKQTGLVQVINCSHELPLLLHSEDKSIPKYEASAVSIPPCCRLGDRLDEVWKIQTIQLQSNDLLILYTDGIFDISNGEGKPYRERMFIKKSKELASAGNSSESFVKKMYQSLYEYGEGKDLVDDITLVTVHFLPATFAEYYLPQENIA